MTNVNDVAMTRLRASGALMTNDEGDDVLIGLTVSESNYFLKWEAQAHDSLSHAEASLYLLLKQRHLLARSSGLLEHAATISDWKKNPPARGRT